MLLPFPGDGYAYLYTQGDALGYERFGLSGRIYTIYCQTA